MSAMQLGRVWAAAPVSPNIDPGAAKWKLGWVPEIPVYQMLNYINNRYDTNIVSLAERGVFEWGGDLDYKLAAIVWDETDGSVYVSKVASPNVAIRPSLNSTQWDKSSVQISRAQYDLAVANWSNHIANTSNPHQLTVDILNTYSKVVIDSKVATVQTALNTHTNNITGNVHNVTAMQAGAVPVTGGSYTGLVKHLFASTGIGATSYAAQLLSGSAGTFLAQGANAKLGLDSSNKAVYVDDSSVKSNLLIESSYIAAREAAESNYVPPSPDCEIAFRNSLVLLSGVGSATFIGPASSRGYLDKSGATQTAPLNTPRYTVLGMLLTNQVDLESLSFPTALNGAGSRNYTYCLDVQSTSTTDVALFYTPGTNTPAILLNSGNYYFRSVLSGTPSSVLIAPVDHTINHKFVVVSNLSLNKTFVYLDGALKATVNSAQDAIPNTSYEFSNSTYPFGARYLNSFRVWLSPLTSQQVSNI